MGNSIRLLNSLVSETVLGSEKSLIKWHLFLYHCCSHKINGKCPLIPTAFWENCFCLFRKGKEKKSILQHTGWLPMYFNGTLSPWYPGTQILAMNWEHQNHSSVKWGQNEYRSMKSLMLIPLCKHRQGQNDCRVCFLMKP